MEATDTRAAWFRTPNLLSCFRIVLVPVLLFLAWNGERKLYLVCLGTSMLSDLVDGFIARRLNQVTELGAKLDSWGDFATYAAIPFCAWWLWPEVIRQEASWVTAAVASYVLPIALGFVKYRRLTSYHTWGDKLSAALVCVAIFFLFGGGPVWPFHIAISVLVLSQLEEIAITLLLPEWRANVASFWHALKITAKSR